MSSETVKKGGGGRIDALPVRRKKPFWSTKGVH